MRLYFMQSERIGFRIWSPADLGLAVALWGDARVSGLIGGPFTEQQVRERLELEIFTQESSGFQYWSIFRLQDDVHLGCCGLRPHPGDDALELGFQLLFEHWRQGYGSEAASAVMNHAFGRLGVEALFAGHHPENQTSARLFQRLGFRHVSDELYPPTGLVHPSYRLTREQFALDEAGDGQASGSNFRESN